MALYQRLPGGYVLREADGASIPPDPANRDYSAFLAWQAAGNSSDPYTNFTAADTTFDADPWQTLAAI